MQFQEFFQDVFENVKNLFKKSEQKKSKKKYRGRRVRELDYLAGLKNLSPLENLELSLIPLEETNERIYTARMPNTNKEPVMPIWFQNIEAIEKYLEDDQIKSNIKQMRKDTIESFQELIVTIKGKVLLEMSKIQALDSLDIINKTSVNQEEIAINVQEFPPIFSFLREIYKESTGILGDIEYEFFTVFYYFQMLKVMRFTSIFSYRSALKKYLDVLTTLDEIIQKNN